MQQIRLHGRILVNLPIITSTNISENASLPPVLSIPSFFTALHGIFSNTLPSHLS
jgi:hypothetical protein